MRKSIIPILLITFYFTIVNTVVIKSPSQSTHRMLEEIKNDQNLLRLTSQTQTSSCVNFNGALCTICKGGFILTDGLCYEVIPNCLIQYANVCATCQPKYKPTTSLSISPKTSLPQHIIICIPETIAPNLTITNTGNSNSPTNSLINPLSLLGRENFINWNKVQVRYPTDVYLVMIWNYLDGNQELKNKVKIQDHSITSCVQGKVKGGTDKLTVIKWVIDNQLTNFVEGNLIDLPNVYFYRLRYKSRITQIEQQILAMIHEVNYKITLLQQVQTTTINGSLGTGSLVGNTLSESDQIKALRQQVLDLKLKIVQQKQLAYERQILTLIFHQYTMLSSETIVMDPNCIVIKSYLENSFGEFIKLLQLEPDSPSRGLYSWMNFSVKRVYFRKIDSINKQFLYEINFTKDITVLAQFILNRTYQITSVKIVFNR